MTSLYKLKSVSLSSPKLILSIEKLKEFEVLKDFFAFFEKYDEELFLVGGALRDLALKREPKDFDFATSCLPEKMLRIFKGFKFKTQGLSYGTLGVSFKGFFFEVTTYRSDEVYKNFRSPESLKFSKSLYEDLKRRDFTCNAIAYSPSRGVIDPHGGLSDLEKNKIKSVGDPNLRFEEDVLRILRLFRFSINYDLNIEKESFQAVWVHFKNLQKVSKERISNEISKLLLGGGSLKKLSEIYKGLTNKALEIEGILEEMSFFCILSKVFDSEILEKTLLVKSHLKWVRFYKKIKAVDRKKEAQTFSKLIYKMHNTKNGLQEFLKLYACARSLNPSESDHEIQLKIQSLNEDVFFSEKEKIKRDFSGKGLGEKIEELYTKLLSV